MSKCTRWEMRIVDEARPIHELSRTEAEPVRGGLLGWTYYSTRSYTEVVVQQGRVQLDDDWNE
jgi:hypothetical protein